MINRGSIIDLQEGEKVLIIGDVHGDWNNLQNLISKVGPDVKLVFVGDLVDRGSYSKQVVDFVKDGAHPCVMGNHEKVMIAALREFRGEREKAWDYRNWIFGGFEGLSTIESFTDEFIHSDKIVPYLEWLESLPYVIQINVSGDIPVFVSHSSLQLNSAPESLEEILDSNKESQVLWNRKHYSRPVNDWCINVFGHSVLPKSDMALKGGGLIGIDNGSVFHKNNGIGDLAGYLYPDREIIFSD